MDKEVHDCSKGIKHDSESNKGFPFMVHSFYTKDEVKEAEAKHIVLSEALARSRVAQSACGKGWAVVGSFVVLCPVASHWAF